MNEQSHAYTFLSSWTEMAEVVVLAYHMQHGNSKKPFISAFLISYEGFCFLCMYFASGLNKSLQNYLYFWMEDAKLM